MIMLLIVCLVFGMMPAFALAASGSNGAAANAPSSAEKIEKEAAEDDGDKDAAQPEEPAAATEQTENAENTEPASVDAETVPHQDKAAEPEKPADEAVPSEQESEKKDPKQEEAAGEDRSEGKDQKQEKPEEKAEKADSEEDFDWLTYEAVDPVPAPVKFRLMQVSTGDEKSYTASRNSADGMQFTVTLNGKEFHGLCCEPAVKAVSSGKAIITKLGKEALSRKIAWKYRNWLNDADRNYNYGGLKKAVILEAMFQYANHKTDAVAQWKDNDWSASTRQAIIDAVNDLKNNETSETLDIPNNFTAYRLEVENKASGGSILGQDGVVWGYPVDGKVQVRKKATAEAQALYEQDPVRYSVKGAKFRLYTDSSCSTKATNVYGNDALLTISRDGIDVTTGTLTMEVGTYYMKEVAKPASGAYDYERDDNGKVKIHTVTVKEDETVTVTFIDDAKETPSGYLVLKKSSDNPTVTNGNSMYSLKGAKYQVYTKAACAESDKAKDANGDNALFEMEADGTTDAIEFELGADANSSLDVWVKEVAAPKGYVLDTRVYGPYKITKNNTAAAALEVSVSDVPAGAAKLTLVKKGKESTDPEKLKGAEFEIEYHDVAGEDDITSRSRKKTWKFVTSVKGSGAAAYAGLDLQTDNKLSGDDFYMNGTQRIFPIGTYKITETKAPSGYKLDPTPTYVTVTQSGAGGTAKFANERIERINEENPRLLIRKVDASGAALKGASLQVFDGNTAAGSSWVSDGSDHEVTGLTAGKTYTLRELAAPAGYDLADDKTFTAPSSGTVTVTMTNVPVTVGTTARSGTTNTKTGVRKSNETIADTIHMTGLTAGRTYKIEGKLMNKRTGAEVPNVTVSPVTFTATAATMDKEMTFTFDSKKLADNDSVVVYETLYRTSAANASETVPSAGKEIASHRNINDAGQTVTYPPVPVTLKKMDSAAGKALSGAKLQILQGSTVKAEWTSDGTDHVIKDLEPGSYVLREISAPYGYEIADDVSFSFDGIKAQTVTMNNRPVTVKTTAVSKTTQKHVGQRKAGEAVTDTVHMTGLVSGRKYRLSGQLMDKDSGAAIKGSAASKEFTASASDMDVAVELPLDPEALGEGGSVVAYETLYRISKVHSESVPAELQKHTDLKDAGQTVIYPLIVTTASMQKGNREVKDVIEYKNLLPDTKYVFKGWLVDTATGEKVAGSDGRAEMKTGSETSGKTEMVLMTEKYDSMSGHSMTAFEELYLIENENGAEKEILIAEHKDKNDKKQTVEIFQDLKIKKNVTGNLGDLTKVFEYSVEFTGLVPGSAYRIEGDDEKTFMADSSGKANAALKLMDDQCAVIRQLPKGATYTVTEAASDHIAEYRVFSEDMEGKGAKISVKEASNGAEAAKMLSTAKETVDLFDGTVVVLWENNRDLATLTGTRTDIGVWAAGFVMAIAGAISLIVRRRNERRMI